MCCLLADALPCRTLGASTEPCQPLKRVCRAPIVTVCIAQNHTDQELESELKELSEGAGMRLEALRTALRVSGVLGRACGLGTWRQHCRE